LTLRTRETQESRDSGESIKGISLSNLSKQKGMHRLSSKMESIQKMSELGSNLSLLDRPRDKSYQMKSNRSLKSILGANLKTDDSQ
jgi:hypothetical protein